VVRCNCSFELKIVAPSITRSPDSIRAAIAIIPKAPHGNIKGNSGGESRKLSQLQLRLRQDFGDSGKVLYLVDFYMVGRGNFWIVFCVIADTIGLIKTTYRYKFHT